MDRATLGRLGEDAVAAFLRERGFSILGRNVRVGRLELDIIARRNRLVIVCEVRTRSTEAFGSAVESITPAKVRRVRRATAQWLGTQSLGSVDLRFDAAGVLVQNGEVSSIDYYEEAF